MPVGGSCGVGSLDRGEYARTKGSMWKCVIHQHFFGVPSITGNLHVQLTPFQDDDGADDTPAPQMADWVHWNSCEKLEDELPTFAVTADVENAAYVVLGNEDLPLLSIGLDGREQHSGNHQNGECNDVADRLHLPVPAREDTPRSSFA